MTDMASFSGACTTGHPVCNAFAHLSQTGGAAFDCEVALELEHVHTANISPVSDGLKLPVWKERKAKQIMLGQMATPVSVTAIAKACSLSRSHFSRAFKHNTGLSPKEWATSMRLKHAQQLMADTTLTLTEISLRCGFADQSHFTRTFHKYTGMPPGAWRDGVLDKLQTTH